MPRWSKGNIRIIPTRLQFLFPIDLSVYDSYILHQIFYSTMTDGWYRMADRPDPEEASAWIKVRFSPMWMQRKMTK